ncbi:MAG TPA: dTDP-4-dehydrorhamnose 3,5-epimerase family protein [Victivallales bacterium]|nr:dTDP-4-dehydrorhamnose 3,5-epimerase family protein [Victivallales bacterium]
MIDGVIVKDLTTHSDERGFFREIIRDSDDFFSEGFGQMSHSLVYAGVIKAWHGHKIQTQWNYITTGLIKVALYDSRENSHTYGKIMGFLAGENQKAQVYSFPNGVLHGYKCISGPMNIIYVTSGTYNIEEEIRVEYNTPEINFDWLIVPEIK